MGKTHVYETESSGLGSDQRSTPASTLSSQDSLPLVLLSSVCAEQVSNLASSNTDISCWYVGVGTDVLAQLAHEGYTESSDLVVGLALWIEVGSSLTSTNVHCNTKLSAQVQLDNYVEDGTYVQSEHS